MKTRLRLRRGTSNERVRREKERGKEVSELVRLGMKKHDVDYEDREQGREEEAEAGDDECRPVDFEDDVAEEGQRCISTVDGMEAFGPQLTSSPALRFYWKQRRKRWSRR